VNGLRFPKWIRIRPYGIDKVELVESVNAAAHYKVRVKILELLYDHHFSDHQEDTILVDGTLIKNLGFSESDGVTIFGDIRYLFDKRLIEGHQQMGMPSPYRIKIAPRGIDLFERIINDSLLEISSKHETAPSQKVEAEEIVNEAEPKTKLERFRAYVGRNAGWIELVANVAKSWIAG
jgi:hypothetical protein